MLYINNNEYNNIRSNIISNAMSANDLQHLETNITNQINQKITNINYNSHNIITGW